ncbi:unnamed protein product [Durusdinium trenchii]|uniref:Uncharacterized protein n=1 Tax=Durusdinium trenchii TaxID=1381693 RepID=A0ABP0SI01_9DINO
MVAYLGRAPAALGERCVGGKQVRRTQWKGSSGGPIDLDVEGILERVEIHPLKGPKLLQADGSDGYFPEIRQRPWDQMPTADQRIMAYRAAKQNRSTKALLADQQAQAEWSSMPPAERLARRCATEIARKPKSWKPISHETVRDKHTQKCKGIFYNMEFPWSENTLKEMGPQWLTKAFHAAGTLDERNAVTELILEKRKVTAGNNSGKFLFEVRYKWQTPDLHRQLFAKIPFPCEGPTRNDRMSSSVNKQPMDFYEVNCYRILESTMPVKLPKFYFGDISNESSNFILITERVQFAGMPPLPPMMIEGPYEKCKDFDASQRPTPLLATPQGAQARKR